MKLDRTLSVRCNLMLVFASCFRRVRTSSGTFLQRGQDKTIRNIEKRIADFTFIPVGMFLVPVYYIFTFEDVVWLFPFPFAIYVSSWCLCDA